MAYYRIRIYDTPEKDGNTIGFSASCSSTAVHPRLHSYLSDAGYKTEVLEYRTFQSNPDEVTARIPVGGVSYSYVEVVPPLSEEAIQQLALMCTREIIDSGHEGILFLDNRQLPPDGPMGSGRLIAES